MHRVTEQLGVFQHVHQIALVANGHAIGNVEDAATALVQADDGVVHFERTAPEHRLGQIIELALGHRRLGALGDARPVRQLDLDQVADLGPQPVQTG